MKIAPVEYALFCDHASVSMDGKLSMNGIFERILTKNIPVVHPMMYVVTKLILPKGEHNISFTLMQEDEVLVKSSAEKKVEAKLGSHIHFWNIKNLKIEKSEPLELQILIGGKQVYVKRLPIVKVQATNDKKDKDKS